MKKTSVHAYIWTTIFILILASFAFVTILTNSKSKTIRENIRELNEEQNDYQKIDSCISLLYVAENNSRLYLVTADPGYLSLYKGQILSVSQILSQYDTKKGSLSKLVARKQSKSREFIYLKMTLDSLMLLSDVKVPEEIPVADARPVPEEVSKTVITDTVLSTSRTEKRRLLRRIFDAIANKEEEETVLARTKTNIIISQAPAANVSTSRPHKPDVAGQLERAKQKLNNTEHQLLTANSRLFATLQQALRNLKMDEEQKAKSWRINLLTSTSAKFEDVSELSWVGVLMVLALATIIIRNLIRVYKNERTILNFAHVTADTTKRKGEFLAHMAHEIRTPLNSIIGFSQLIDAQKLEDDLKGNVDAIKNASVLLLTLVNDILDFSKFESGKVTLMSKVFRPEKLVRDAVEMLSILAAEKRIQLTTQFDVDPKLHLNGDEFRIKQVVINLVTNAIKFTPPEGRITVSLSFNKSNEQKGVLKIHVKDSGVGIAAKHLSTIFDDFTQIENREHYNTQLGTGLGLGICKRIVDLYGGNIAVESVEGQGSEFKVAIPLQIATVTPETIRQSPILIPAKNLSGKKVLVADDTKMNLILIGKILDKHDITYDLAADGEEAFVLFNGNRYDLIILDIQMPKMNGIELTKRIRSDSDSGKSALPVLAFTGNVTAESKAVYLDAGINDVLEKPFEEPQLMHLLLKWMKQNEVG